MVMVQPVQAVDAERMVTQCGYVHASAEHASWLCH